MMLQHLQEYCINFSKTAPALELKAGIVEGTYYDADAIKVVAAIPGRDELLGRLLGSIKSPISNLARVLNQVAEKAGSLKLVYK